MRLCFTMDMHQKTGFLILILYEKTGIAILILLRGKPKLQPPRLPRLVGPFVGVGEVDGKMSNSRNWLFDIN